MFSTILIVVFALVAVGALVAAVFARDKGGPLLTFIAATIATIVTVALACTVQVSTRNVGILTTFGRPGGELSNGFHLVAPWQDVVEMDGAIQQENFTGNDHALTVRLGNNSTAKADVQIQWRIKPDAASSLFLDYRDFDNVRDQLVNKELNVALNKEFASFDPLAAASVPGAPADGANLASISGKVEKDVQDAVGNRVEVQKVFVPLVSYDQATQDRINALNVEKQNTLVAQQRGQTAKADADANNTLSASVNNNPNVLVSKCLDAAAKNNSSPIGCWPNSTQPGLPVIPLGK